VAGLLAEREDLGARQFAHRVDLAGVNTALEPGRVGLRPVDRHAHRQHPGVERSRKFDGQAKSPEIAAT
jgi:hypothetical protein